jgi:tRNA-splicing ligase RtcB
VSGQKKDAIMETSQLIQHSACEWEIAPYGRMRVPAIIYATEALIRDMDQKVYEQVTNVATLPGIVKAAYAMPDAHWGYGFPIGGVAAFDPDHGGVISAGGVGFDIILAGTQEGMTLAFGSACHGAGRSMSRHQAFRQWKGREVIESLASRGILIRSPSARGVAEEAPGAYKDVRAVADAAEQAQLAHKVARLEPLVCIKG